MHSDVEITVLCKEQFDGAMAWLVENKHAFEFNVTMGDSLTPDEFHLRVPDICWANNLKEFAEVLSKSDYNSDIVEEDV
jgi:hypothetical protein